MINRYLVALLVSLFALQAHAQVQQSRGQYSINYKSQIGAFDRAAVPPATKQKAQQEAMLKAVETYYAEAGQSQSANFDAIRSKILADPSRYILDSTVIDEADNPKDYQYTVVVRVSLNVANLRNAVQANSAIANTSGGAKSMLSFVFVARQVDATKSYDDRVYKRQDKSFQAAADRKDRATVNEKSNEGESVKGSQVGTYGASSKTTEASVAVNAKSSTTSETGGSTTRKSSDSTWRLLPSADFNQVFTDQFTQAGYDVVDSAMVESDKFKIIDIENDYKSGNDLQSKTVREIATGMKEAQIPYVALGTLDVGLAEKDAQSGLMRVSVNVNAKVWDVTKPIPRTRVAVGPVSYTGSAPTEDQARLAALKLAANSAARELSSRMANIGLH